MKIQDDDLFAISPEFINLIISRYHQWMIDDDSYGEPWENRWEFIYREINRGLKRKSYWQCYKLEKGLELQKKREERKKILKEMRRKKKAKNEQRKN